MSGLADLLLPIPDKLQNNGKFPIPNGGFHRFRKTKSGKKERGTPWVFDCYAAGYEGKCVGFNDEIIALNRRSKFEPCLELTHKGIVAVGIQPVKFGRSMRIAGEGAFFTRRFEGVNVRNDSAIGQPVSMAEYDVHRDYKSP